MKKSSYYTLCTEWSAISLALLLTLLIAIGINTMLTMLSGIADLTLFAADNVNSASLIKESLGNTEVIQYVDARNGALYAFFAIIVMVFISYVLLINIIVPVASDLIVLLYCRVTKKKTLEERIKALEEKKC